MGTDVTAVFLSPLRGLFPNYRLTHGLRRELHPIAASRLTGGFGQTYSQPSTY
jgi:hypothetical protein